MTPENKQYINVKYVQRQTDWTTEESIDNHVYKYYDGVQCDYRHFVDTYNKNYTEVVKNYMDHQIMNNDGVSNMFESWEGYSIMCLDSHDEV